MRKVVSWSCSAHRKYFAVPTRPAARPPNACDSAVRCGTAVSGTHDNGMPASAPSTSGITIQLYPMMSGWSSVPMMASAMPPTPAKTPRRAVDGSLIHLREKMNSAVATR